MLFYFNDMDYEIMKRHNWTTDFVEDILTEYSKEYNLSLSEVEDIFNLYGVNELFDGIPMACEEYAKML